MSMKSAFCFVTSREQADQLVDHLRRESFSENGISVFFSDPAGGVADAPTGTLPGTPLGWLAGIGRLTMPGLGTGIGGGPIVAALSGAAGGGITGGLMRLGLDEVEARRCEGHVKGGNLLIFVHTDDVGDIARAKDIFNQAGGQDICITGVAPRQGCIPSELSVAA